MISDSSQKEPEPHIACQLALPAGDAEIDSIYDVELERRTLRKFDFFVLPQFMIMVLISYLDRSNIGISKGRELLHYAGLALKYTQATRECLALKKAST